MREPLVLWAALLAVLPWLPFFRRPRPARRVFFPSFFAFIPRKARQKRSRRDLFRAFFRSLTILALVLVWADPIAPTVPKEPPSAPERLPVQTTEPRVLIVDGSDAASTKASAAASSAQYLAWALDPTETDSRVEARYSSELASLSSRELARADVIVLADVPDPNIFDRLAQAPKSDDRTIILWSGARTVPERWNEYWKKRGLALETTEINADDRASAFPQSPETPLETRFRASFPSFENSGLDVPPFARATPTSGPDAEPILRDRATNAPLFARIASNVYWLAVGADSESGALALTPSFPTFVEKALRFASDARSMPRAPRPERARAKFSFLQALWIILALSVVADAVLAPNNPKRRASPRP